MGCSNFSYSLSVCAKSFPFFTLYFTSRYVMRTKYLEKSKLKTVPIYLDGIRSQVMFTSWTCNLLTLSLAINGIITLLSESSDQNTIFHLIFHHKLMLRFAVIIFEICAPTSMLVSFVVRYGKLQKRHSNSLFFSFIFSLEDI